MSDSTSHKRHVWLVFLVLIAVCAGIYWPVAGYGFVNFDDHIYVYENPLVMDGLTFSGVKSAFVEPRIGNWHPLTWLSLMLDSQLFGVNPGAFHVVNLLFHMANSILLYIALRSLTGAHWRSAAVALLFAIHPLHAEPVVWISSRKDVLSAFFWFLTLIAYARYVKLGHKSAYVLALLCLALGLMSKAMLVTLPFLLLVLDVWPLGRLAVDTTGGNRKAALRKLLLDKIPLLVLIGLACVVAYFAQKDYESMSSFGNLPLLPRAGNAAVSYATYAAKTLWPHDLAVFYPHPGLAIPTVLVAGAAAFLFLVTAAALALFRRRPYLLVGWLWFLGTLAPVIGIVQVGKQAMADRYMYLPITGLLIMTVWAVFGVAQRFSTRGRIAVGAVCLVCCAVLGVYSAKQVTHWEDTLSLWRQAARVTPGNAAITFNVAGALDEEGFVDEAIAEYERTLELDPNMERAQLKLMDLMPLKGQGHGDVKKYERELSENPGDPGIHYRLGKALARGGRRDEAREHYREAIRLDANHAGAHTQLGLAALFESDFAEAERHFALLAEVYPGDADHHTNLGVALAEQGRLEEARAAFKAALEIDPEHENALGALEILEP